MQAGGEEGRHPGQCPVRLHCHQLLWQCKPHHLPQSAGSFHLEIFNTCKNLYFWPCGQKYNGTGTGLASTFPCTPPVIFPQDVPSRVPLMEVEDYSSRAANLSWTPPYDGNSPITTYNIIYKTYRWFMHLAYKESIAIHTSGQAGKEPVRS